MKQFYTLFLVFIFSFNFSYCKEFKIKNVPIHENGRIKPLDTFLKNQLLILYGKRTLKSSALVDNLNNKKLNADDWFSHFLKAKLRLPAKRPFPRLQPIPGIPLFLSLLHLRRFLYLW